MLQWDTWNVNEGVVYKQHKGSEEMAQQKFRE